MGRSGSNVAKLTAFAFVAFVLLSFFLFGGHSSHDAPSSNDGKVTTNIRKAQTQPPENDYVAEFYKHAPPVACPSKFFSEADLKLHNEPSNLWLHINGMVLNVTDFVTHHPGGLAILQGGGGPDAKETFMQFHQPSTIGLFQKFCIGKIRGV